MTRLLYPPNEAAALLGLGRSKLYELLATGQLESVKVGKSRLIPADALDAFVARLRSGADAA